MEASEVRDDLDVLESVRHQTKTRHTSRVTTSFFVPRYRASQSTDEQVEHPVAVEVRQIGNVLSVGKQRYIRCIAQRVRREYERHTIRPLVGAIIPQVAELLLGEQIQVTISIHIGKTKPLTNLQVLVSIRTPYELRHAICSHALEVE